MTRNYFFGEPSGSLIRAVGERRGVLSYRWRWCRGASTDDDQDGIADLFDPFPLDPRQSADLDGDGVGDAFHTDIDNDGVVNDRDIRPKEWYRWQELFSGTG